MKKANLITDYPVMAILIIAALIVGIILLTYFFRKAQGQIPGILG